jgi:hypothetical protein
VAKRAVAAFSLARRASSSSSSTRRTEINDQSDRGRRVREGHRGRRRFRGSATSALHLRRRPSRLRTDAEQHHVGGQVRMMGPHTPHAMGASPSRRQGSTAGAHSPTLFAPAWTPCSPRYGEVRVLWSSVLRASVGLGVQTVLPGWRTGGRLPGPATAATHATSMAIIPLSTPCIRGDIGIPPAYPRSA